MDPAVKLLCQGDPPAPWPRRYLIVSNAAPPLRDGLPECTVQGPGERLPSKGAVYWLAYPDELQYWNVTEIQCVISPETLADPNFVIPLAWRNWVVVNEDLPSSCEEVASQREALWDAEDHLKAQTEALTNRQRPLYEAFRQRHNQLADQHQALLAQDILAETGIVLNAHHHWVYEGEPVSFSLTPRGKVATFRRRPYDEDEEDYHTTAPQATWADVVAEVQRLFHPRTAWILVCGEPSWVVAVFETDPRKGGTPTLGTLTPKVQQELVAGKVPEGYVLQKVSLNNGARAT